MVRNDLPVIVVVAHDRPAALSRLLRSLDRSTAAADHRLVISIDPGGPHQDEVRALAEGHPWAGSKEVMLHPAPLGLREHVLSCGDLTRELGPVLILEDDLMVSPAVLLQAGRMIRAYGGDDRIAGISLYSYVMNENAGLPFLALPGPDEVLFMRTASSWGQVWTPGQWSGFRSWLADRVDWEYAPWLPANVNRWPATSWKKFFIRYLEETGRYFVFPAASFTSNCGDPGTHHRRTSNLFRSPMQWATSESDLPELGDGSLRYDAHFELDPALVKAMRPDLAHLDFAMDLYGTKDLNGVKEPMVFTTRPCRRVELEFGLQLELIELNILADVQGGGIRLARTADVLPGQDHRLDLFRYYNRYPRWVFEHLVPSFREQLGQRLAGLTGIGPVDRAIARTYARLRPRDRS